VAQPDLFVVCKNCGSEVSPYVTECPYCGQRVRKRAPKLDRGGEDAEPRAKQRRRPRLTRLRPNEVDGIAPDSRPVATVGLIAVSLAVTLVLASGALLAEDLGGLVLPSKGQYWRSVSTLFIYEAALGYQFIALVAVGVFGSSLERRFGGLATVALFLLAGAAGAAAAAAVSSQEPFNDLVPPDALILGGNGAALGLLCAWLVDDRRAARRGEDRGSDLLGVYVFCLLLALLPLATVQANAFAGLVGAVTGALLGKLLPLLARSG